MSEPLHNIFGVEIFAPGVHNGDKYTMRDLQDMVDAYDKVGYVPPLKPGHIDDEGAPALGWVRNLRIVGEKLVADFMDIPKFAYDIIKRHGWDAVSSEIFEDLKRDGKLYRRALAAVALLGIHVPAVPFLKPLRDVVFSGDGTAIVKKYQFKSHREGSMSDENKLVEEQNKKISSLEAQIADLKKHSEGAISEQKKTLTAQLEATQNALAEEQKKAQKKIFELEEGQRKDRIASKVKGIKLPSLRKHFQALYDAATTETKTVKFSQKDGEAEKDTPTEEVIDSLVAVINQKAERLFGEKGGSKQEERQSGAEMDDPGAEVDRRAKEYMEKNQVKDYKTAMHKVLEADPELKELYVSTQ